VASFEERLKAVMEEVQRSQGDIIMMIDELHTVIGAGAAQGAMDASNMLQTGAGHAANCNVSAQQRWMNTISILKKTLLSSAVSRPSMLMNQAWTMPSRCCTACVTAMRRITRCATLTKALDAAVHLATRYVTDRACLIRRLT